MDSWITFQPVLQRADRDVYEAACNVVELSERGPQQLEPPHARCESSEDGMRFQSRQTLTGAAMIAESEGEVSLSTADVKEVRFAAVSLVAVG